MNPSDEKRLDLIRGISPLASKLEFSPLIARKEKTMKVRMVISTVQNNVIF